MTSNSWLNPSPEMERMVSEEQLILACTELVYQAMDDAGVESKQELATMLGVSKNEISQRLSGKRNLTVKTLAAMLHVLGREAEVTLRPRRALDTDLFELEADVIPMRQVIRTPKQNRYSKRPIHVDALARPA
ncbi:helix-turn-helix DNA binding domain protein [Gordonia phage Floral]|nr:helix-turn-helix DNA binding domain protein [Gordonia phage Floral]